MGFPGSSAGIECDCNAGDSCLIPGLGRYPGVGIGYPIQYSWASLVTQMVKNLTAMQYSLQYSCLENPYGQRSLLGYSPWGHKESDVTERLSTAQHKYVQCVYVYIYVQIRVYTYKYIYTCTLHAENKRERGRERDTHAANQKEQSKQFHHWPQWWHSKKHKASNNSSIYFISHVISQY